MAKKKTKSTAGKRAALIALCIVLGLILAVLLGGTIYAEYLLNRMNYVNAVETQPPLSQEELEAIENGDDETIDPDSTAPVVDENDVDWGSEVEVEIGGDNIVNILLIGQDTRKAGERARSDSMILCTFNKEKKTLTMTSFMRDLYVQIPGGYKDNRINAAYTMGGMELLDNTLYTNFGVKIDGNVEVDFDQFSDIIDLLGGVTIELTVKEANYINWKCPTPSAVSSGVQLLNGDQALTYARNRNDVDGDFSRTNRQRKLLSVLVETYKNKSVTEMLSLFDDILPMVTTDLTKSEITTYIKDLFPLLAECEIITQHIPVDNGYYAANIRGMSVLVPYMDVNRQALIDSLAD